MNTDVFPLLDSFNISGSALRIAINDSIFWEESEISKGVRNIRDISVLVGYKQEFVISIPILHKSKKISVCILSIFINSFSVFKMKGLKRFVAVCETASQYGVC